MTERDFQRAVVELARLMGWRVHHTRPALTQRGRWLTPIQGDAGFPDLVLCRPPRLVLAELKRWAHARHPSSRAGWTPCTPAQASSAICGRLQTGTR
jgi:hypothetical protein